MEIAFDGACHCCFESFVSDEALFLGGFLNLRLDD